MGGDVKRKRVIVTGEAQKDFRNRTNSVMQKRSINSRGENASTPEAITLWDEKGTGFYLLSGKKETRGNEGRCRRGAVSWHSICEPLLRRTGRNRLCSSRG